ncbi:MULTISPECIES: putative zinc-binding metallopeptidase [unclassified Thioalkalivibrio]|uniref:zinc-binding metallopeptidase family protein n=1 Tax=unclassified Thioalkalivibrio TaxID=2621013 RepID=UPI0003744DE6|nr:MULTISPECIES: putative zinc-binding peptidase [unclassified Thioalkalivibrio]
MQLFECEFCGQGVYFDNTYCTRCGHRLGFLPDRLEVSALAPAGEATDARGHPVPGGLWRVADEPDGALYRQCRHYAVDAVCNWMVPHGDADPFCRACRLNRTIPDLSVPGNARLWERLETEKRRLVYGLLRLGLPVVPRRDDPKGIAFDFLADTAPEFREGGGVVTGHANGLITLNIAEADPAVRERMREAMAEPYRTILGHFRHESAHYYWDRLIRDTPWHAAFRERFGDERADYDEALRRHYADGPPAEWQASFVSAYASSHPWEDWAETWAHYLHIVDTLDTASAYNMDIVPGAGPSARLGAQADAPAFDAYAAADFDGLMEHWLPLVSALNSLNRSMGHPHVYPFVLTATAIAKLAFVHQVIQDFRTDCRAALAGATGT